jgi:hypothetical protein
MPAAYICDPELHVLQTLGSKSIIINGVLRISGLAEGQLICFEFPGWGRGASLSVMLFEFPGWLKDDVKKDNIVVCGVDGPLRRATPLPGGCARPVELRRAKDVAGIYAL